MNNKNTKGNAVRITANLKKEWTNLVSNTTKAEAQHEHEEVHTKVAFLLNLRQIF